VSGTIHPPPEGRGFPCSGLVKFGNRFCDLSALVLGDESLLGVVPMEMMDLILHPATQSITLNPASPYVPVALAK
jgi:hypothetical protein